MRRRLAHGAAVAPTPLRLTRAGAAASPTALWRHRRRSARPAHAPPPRPRRCGGTDAAPLDPRMRRRLALGAAAAPTPLRSTRPRAHNNAHGYGAAFARASRPARG